MTSETDSGRRSETDSQNGLLRDGTYGTDGESGCDRGNLSDRNARESNPILIALDPYMTCHPLAVAS